MVSASAPPAATVIVVVVMSAKPEIPPSAVKETAPLASIPLVITYLSITIFPSIKDLPTTPSPK